MPRRSKIDLLPPELRKEVDILVANQALTLEDMVAALKKLNVELSMSGLHRYKQKIDVVGERIRRSREMAEAIVSRFGDVPEDKVLQMNVQFLHSAIMDIMATSDDDGEPVQLSPMQAMALSKAVGELARATKTDADRLLKVRREAAEKTVDAVDSALKSAKQPGITKQMRDDIRRAVLGVAA